MKPRITLEPHPSAQRKVWLCKYPHYRYGCLGNTPQEAYKHWNRNRAGWMKAEMQAELAKVKAAMVIDKAMGVW